MNYLLLHHCMGQYMRFWNLSHMPLINAHADISNRASGPKFEPSSTSILCVMQAAFIIVIVQKKGIIGSEKICFAQKQIVGTGFCT